ncbi:hypothetical protein R6Z07F_008337 [Ovis aries]
MLLERCPPVGEQAEEQVQSQRPWPCMGAETNLENRRGETPLLLTCSSHWSGLSYEPSALPESRLRPHLPSPRAAPPPPRPASIPGPAPRARGHPGPALAAPPWGPFPVGQGRLRGGPAPALSIAGGSQMQAERGARGGRGRRPGRGRPGGDRDRERAGAGTAVARGGGGDGGGRRGRGRGFRGGRGGRGGGAPRGGRREPGGRGARISEPIEDDSDAETYGEENEEQGNYSKRKIVSNWDRYQDTEKEVDNESGESQRGTDFSVLLSSAAPAWAICVRKGERRLTVPTEEDTGTPSHSFGLPRRKSGMVKCHAPNRIQHFMWTVSHWFEPFKNCLSHSDSMLLRNWFRCLPCHLRLVTGVSVYSHRPVVLSYLRPVMGTHGSFDFSSNLTALPLELPQVKPKRNNDGKGLGMQLKGPLGPGGKGSLSEMKSTTAGFPMYPGKDGPGSGPSKGSQNPTSLLQLAADHLEEELDLLLNLDAPVKEGGDVLSDQTAQDLGSEKSGQVAQEAAEPANPSVLEEKNVTSGQPSISRNVTEEELEDWLDSMIS